ncbi:hypothetical protein ACQUE3_00200 [Enterococcus casseliflavus]|uniref:hypothetical protein n=1 Tax=Enterococcus casseliflavus TaxID=37734 RepID=UPI003D1016C1
MANQNKPSTTKKTINIPSKDSGDFLKHSKGGSHSNPAPSKTTPSYGPPQKK